MAGFIDNSRFNIQSWNYLSYGDRTEQKQDLKNLKTPKTVPFDTVVKWSLTI